MRCIRMELGEPDASGAAGRCPSQGSEFEIPASAVISAISQEPDFGGFEAVVDGKEWIEVDDEGATKLEGCLGRRRRDDVGPGHHGHRPRPPGGRGHRPQDPGPALRARA